MNACELLRSDKKLTEWWVSVCHDSRFDLVMALCRSHLGEKPIDYAQMTGVNLFIDALRTITEGETNSTEFPSAGLIHLFNAPKPPEPPPKA